MTDSSNLDASSASTPSRGANASFASDSFFGLTVAEAAKKYLSGMKKTAPAKGIADALVAGGFKTAAENFVETVRTMLSRNPQFLFVNGGFGLAEWYAGRKPPMKKAQPSLSVASSRERDPSPEEIDAVFEQVSSEQMPLC